jgi:S1-C subfamily serine protease
MEDGYIPCPHCAEPIRSEAKFCRYCRRRVSSAVPARRWVLYGILAAVAFSVCYYDFRPPPDAERQTQRASADMAGIGTPSTRITHASAAHARRELSTGEIYREATPSVVLIDTFDDQGRKLAQGSGFVVSSGGSVLTNYHVIRGAYSAVVRFANNETAPILGVVGYDQGRDVAVVTVASATAPPLSLGTASSLQVGDRLVALGSPEGLQNTTSEGIVSALRGGLIQMSTPISHGSSGGPVLDAHGRVVGIAVAIVAAGENLNFAVPIDWATKYIGQSASESLAQIAESNTVTESVFTGPIVVPARGRQGWTIRIDPNRMSDPELYGDFQSSGGPDGLVRVTVACNPGGLLYDSQRARYGQVLVNLPPKGACALLVDNTPSIMFGRTVTGTITLRYVR